MTITSGQRIRSGGVKMTVLGVNPDTYTLKIGWFNSMAEAVEGKDTTFEKPHRWVEERVLEQQILDG